MSNTLQAATDAKAAQAVETIIWWVREGFDFDFAVQQFLNSTTFGPKMIERVVAAARAATEKA